LFYNYFMENNQKKILLVDDSTYLRNLKGAYLKRKTCNLIEAKDGEEALLLLVEEKPDLIIMDLTMPLVRGDECCRIIKNHPDYSQIPVIMIANAWEKDAETQCKDAGCDDFIMKPVKREHLYWSIKQYLNIAERVHRRATFEAKAIAASSGIEYRGISANIGIGGVFIRSNEGHRAGSAVKVELPLRSKEKPYILEGQVAWLATEEDVTSGLTPGMGIKFINLPSETKSLIEMLVK